MDRLGIIIDTKYNLNIKDLRAKLDAFSKSSGLKLDLNFDASIYDKLTKTTEKFINGSNEANIVVTKMNEKMGKTVTITKQLNKATGDYDETLKTVVIDQNKIVKEAEKIAKTKMNSSHTEALVMNKDYNASMKETLELQYKIRREAEKVNKIKIEQAQVEALAINKEYDSSYDETLNLQYKIAREAEKIAATEQKTQVAMEKQLKAAKDKFEIDSRTTKRKYGNIGNTAEDVNDIARSLNNVVVQEGKFIDATNRSEVELRDFSTELKRVEANAKDLGFNSAQQDVRAFGDELAHSAKKFMEFYVIGGVISGLFREFKDGVSNLNLINKSLTDIRVVTGMNALEAMKLGKSYNAMGKSMGATTTELLSGATEWYRQGKTNLEAQELVKASIIESKLAATTSAEATEYLTSVLNGYKMEAKDVMTIVDQMVSVDNSAATSVAELSLALQRSSNSAAQAGVGLNKLLGYVGTVSSVTRKSAESIGESFKTMFSRMENVKLGQLDEDGLGINDVEIALNNVGISIRDSQDEFRNMGSVLDDVSDKWGTLTGVEQSAIAGTIAGIRQRENFLVLMNNYATAVDLSAEALNSEGLAVERYGIYLQETESALNTFKVTSEGLWQNTISSETIQNVIGLGTGLLNLVDSFGLLKSLIPIVVTLFATYNKTTRTMITSLILSKTARDTETAGIHANTAAKSANTIATTAMMSAMTFGISLLAVGVITSITTAIGKMTKAVEEQRETVENLNTEIDDLNTKIKELYEKKEVSNSDIIELDVLERQLAVKKELQKIENEKLMNKELFGQGFGSGVKQELNNIEKSVSGLQSFFNESGVKPEAIVGYREGVLELENTLLSQEQTLERYKKMYGDELPMEAKVLETSIESLKSGFEELYYTMWKANGNDGTIEDFRQIRIEMEKISKSGISDGLDKATDSFNSLAEAQEAAIKIQEDAVRAMDDFQSSASSLASISEELAKNGKLEASSIIDLIQKYPQYTSRILDLNSGKESSINLSEALFNVEKSLAVQKANEALASAKLVAANFSEVKSLKSIFDMKNKLSQFKKFDDGTYGFGTKVTDKAFQEQQNADKIVRDSEAALKYINSLSLSDFSKSDTSSSTKSTSTLDPYFKQLNELNELKNQQSILENKQELDKQDRSKEILTNLDLQQKKLHEVNELRRKDESILKSQISKMSAKEKLSEKGVKLQEELADLTNDIATTSNEWLTIENEKTKLLSEQAELRKTEYKDQLDIIESIRSNVESLVKQELQDEIDAYSAIVDKQIEQLDNEEKLSNYAKSRGELTEEIAKLQNNLTSLSLDDSNETIAEKLTLEKQLKDKRKALTDLSNAYSKAEEKQALQDSKEAYTKSIQEKLNSASFIVEETNRRMTEMLSGSANTLYDELVTWNSVYGTGIDTDITGAWDKAIVSLQKYKSLLPGATVGDITNALSKGTESGFSIKELSTRAQMMSNSSQWKETQDPTVKKALHDANVNLAKEIGAIFDVATGRYKLRGAYLYANGGMVDSPTLGILGEQANDKDWIFNNGQLKQVLKESTKLAVARIFSNESSPKINNNSSVSSNNRFYITGTFDSKERVNDMTDSIENMMARKGLIVNNNN